MILQETHNVDYILDDEYMSKISSMTDLFECLVPVSSDKPIKKLEERPIILSPGIKAENVYTMFDNYVVFLYNLHSLFLRGRGTEPYFNSIVFEDTYCNKYILKSIHLTEYILTIKIQIISITLQWNYDSKWGYLNLPLCHPYNYDKSDEKESKIEKELYDKIVEVFKLPVPVCIVPGSANEFKIHYKMARNYEKLKHVLEKSFNDIVIKDGDKDVLIEFF